MQIQNQTDERDLSSSRVQEAIVFFPISVCPFVTRVLFVSSVVCLDHKSTTHPRNETIGV